MPYKCNCQYYDRNNLTCTKFSDGFDTALKVCTKLQNSRFVNSKEYDFKQNCKCGKKNSSGCPYDYVTSFYQCSKLRSYVIGKMNECLVKKVVEEVKQPVTFASDRKKKEPMSVEYSNNSTSEQYEYNDEYESQGNLREEFEHYLYQLNDYEKARNIITDAQEEDPNRDFNSELFWAVEFSPEYLCFALEMSNKLSTDGYNIFFDENINEIPNNPMEFLKEGVEAFSGCVAFACVGEFNGSNYYNIAQFCSKYDYDVKEVDKLIELRDAQSSDRAADRYQSQIDSILSQYEINMFEFGLNYMNLTNLTSLPSLARETAKKYSVWLDTIYTMFLDRVIRLHKADFLKSKYPSSAQRAKIRAQIEAKILKTLQETMVDVNTMVRDINTANNLYKQYLALDEATNSNAIVEKGVMSAVIGLISGPAGLINGIREVSNYDKNKTKKENVHQELDKVCENFLGQYDAFGDKIIDARENLKSSFIAAGNNYLIPAFLDVLRQLKKHNIKLAPINYYFAK